MNNARLTECLRYGLVAFFFLLALRPVAQGVKIVKKIKIYKQQVQIDSNYRLAELKGLIPEILYDLRYAGAHNFTGEKLYPSGDITFMRLPAAKALATVQQELHAMGYGIRVFDAYRPYSVTKKMWDLVHDERYVANPAKGSGHNRGLAIDLTLYHLATGLDLDMGTGFDNFTDTAHHAFKDLPEKVLSNRRLLRQTMEKAGFTALETEWWHYAWPNRKQFEVLDLSFSQLRQITFRQ